MGTLRVGAMGPMLGFVGEANQRRRRVQRDKKVVWERPGVCVSACAIVWWWWAQQGRGELDTFLEETRLRQATRCQLTFVHARNCLAGDGQSSHSVGLVDEGRGASRVDGETDVEIG